MAKTSLRSKGTLTPLKLAAIKKTKSKKHILCAKDKPIAAPVEAPAPVKAKTDEVIVLRKPRIKITRPHAPIMRPTVLPVSFGREGKEVEGAFAPVLIYGRTERRTMEPNRANACKEALIWVEVLRGNERNGEGVIRLENLLAQHLPVSTPVRYAGGTANTPAKLVETYR